MAVSLHQLLKTMLEMGGSDLHVTNNSPPQIRVDGKLRPLDMPSLTTVETKQLAYSVLTDNQKHRFEETLELDFSFGIKNLARFRANVFQQRGSVAAVYRTIPYEIKGFKELGLPPVIAQICDKPRGLVLLASQDLETLDQRQTSVDHDRELADEDRHVLVTDTGPELRKGNLLPLLFDAGDEDLLTAEHGNDRVLRVRGSLS